MTEILQTKNATKTYMMGTIPVNALNGVTFSINEGELVSVLGPSGSGKSTLLNLIGALDRPTSGNIIIDGIDISTLDDNQLADVRKKVGFCFQFFNLVPRLDAQANVELPLIISGVSRKERKTRVLDALTEVGLADRIHHKSSELSGGERQRVAVARALVTEPSFLLMDEPTGNLDSQTAQDIMDLVLRLNNQLQMTVIIVTHDQEISECTRRILQMRDGLIVSNEVK
jgi:putative ABC transport system ATP-binding protein